MTTPIRFPAARRLATRTRALVGAGALALTLAACGGAEGAAENAAKKWLDALNEGNLTAAAEMSTETTKALIQMAGAMGQSMGPGKYDITDVEMTGDTTAQVTVDAEKDKDDTVLNLVRVDGQWKVGFKK